MILDRTSTMPMTSEPRIRPTRSRGLRLLQLIGIPVLLLVALFATVRLGQAGGAVRYVAPTGTDTGDCTNPAQPCQTIQYAVDQATDGDEIRVAGGAYTGVQSRVSTTTGYTYTQVVLVDGKNLTLRGGFPPGSWDQPDPQGHPSVIDAQGGGRGVTLLGSDSRPVTVTVDGFQIVNGDYTELGNPPGVANAACPSTGGDCAGGLLAYRVRLFLRNTLIRDNTASRTRLYSQGGGALLWGTLPGTVLENVQIFSNTNTQEGYGGGILVHYAGSLSIRNSQFDNNHATFSGGGLRLISVSGPITITDSRFVGNSAVGRDDAIGGAIHTNLSDQLFLDRVEFRDNRASEDGAALSIRQVGSGRVEVDMVNVLAAGNRLVQPGAGGSTVLVRGGTLGELDVRVRHATLAENQTPGAIHLAQSWQGISFRATLTNTLVTSATAAFVGSQDTKTLAIHDVNSLLYNVQNPTLAAAGAPTFTNAGRVTGDPKLDANQRLQAGSAAIDAGVDTGVSLDIDGGARPAGQGYDIGADEYATAAPGALRFSQGTYGVDEGQVLTVTVERVGGTGGAVTVRYGTRNGTAVAGQDYQSISGTLSFGPGEVHKTFTVTILQDTVYEPDETFVLELSNPTGGATLDDPAQATVTIRDDDVAPFGSLRFRSNTYTVAEDAGVATITVERVNGSSGQVGVQYKTLSLGSTAEAGKDYQETQGTLTFQDGETLKSFTVPILDDKSMEPDETVRLLLFGPSGGAELGDPSEAILTIQDNDTSWLYLPLVTR